MKSSGFTLIELLAVIVILAIIALIATPIVLNIIDDSKKSSQQESIKIYASAIEKAIGNYLLKNPNDKNLTLNKINDYINYSGEKVECEIMYIYPSGKIYLDKCKVGGVEIEYTYGEKEKIICTLVEDTGKKGPSIGDKYTCEVIENMEKPYTFYILSIEDNKVNLIMNQNICSDGTPSDKYRQCRYAWHWQTKEFDENDNRYGPDIAMTNLYNGTKGWNNIPDMIMNYEDENNKNDDMKGYKAIKTNSSTKITTIIGKYDKISQYQTFGNINDPLKARLPKLKEIIDAGCHIFKTAEDYGSCPSWLLENMVYQDVSIYEGSGYTDKYSINNGNKITDIHGYWLLSSGNNRPDGGTYAASVGRVDSGNTGYVSGYGVRAVISMPIYNLSY